MRPIGLLLGGVDFTNLFINLSGQAHTTLKAAKEAGADHPGLPVLPDERPDQGDPMRALHV